MSDVKDQITAELARLAKGGAFSEAFWQRMFDEGGRGDYFAAREARRTAAYQLAREAKLATAGAQTVEERRNARKLTKKAKVAAGLLRLYDRNHAQDPLAKKFHDDTIWISRARDLGCYLVRWHQDGKF